jgi:hypothetical protein
MARDFDSADAVQDELVGAVVYVHDEKKEWRADGKGFGDYESLSNGAASSGRPPGRVMLVKGVTGTVHTSNPRTAQVRNGGCQYRICWPSALRPRGW